MISKFLLAMLALSLILTSAEVVSQETDQDVIARGGVVELRADLDAEVDARIAADEALEATIDEETEARIAADNAEAVTRESADAGLQAEIDAEEIARANGDADLQAQIEELSGSSGPTFTRTIVVSPVGSPAENGQILRDTIENLDLLDPPPSTENPYLVKLEPGIYNIGASNLLLNIDHVDLEGSGRNLTKIVGDASASGVLFISRISMDLRDLTVEHPGNTLAPRGIFLVRSEVNITNVTVKTGPSSISESVGITVASGLNVLRNVTAMAADAVSFSAGIRTDADVDMFNVTAVGSSAAIGAGLFIAEPLTPITVKARESRFSGVEQGIFVSAGTADRTVNLVSTQIINSITVDGPLATLRCVGAYDADFFELGANCF